MSAAGHDPVPSSADPFNGAGGDMAGRDRRPRSPEHMPADTYTMLRGPAVAALDEFPGDTATEQIIAMRDRLQEAAGLIGELLRFLPYEKPEEGPLPEWIGDIDGRARAFIGGLR